MKVRRLAKGKQKPLTKLRLRATKGEAMLTLLHLRNVVRVVRDERPGLRTVCLGTDVQWSSQLQKRTRSQSRALSTVVTTHAYSISVISAFVRMMPVSPVLAGHVEAVGVALAGVDVPLSHAGHTVRFWRSVLEDPVPVLCELSNETAESVHEHARTTGSNSLAPSSVAPLSTRPDICYR